MREYDGRDTSKKIPPLYWAAAAFVLLLAVTLGVLAALQSRQSQDAEPLPLPEAEEDWGAFVSYQGQRYVRKDDLKLILFLGVDNVTYESQAVGNGGRADTIILLLLNTREKTAELLSIPRDTMVTVDVYDADGRRLNSGLLQITMQYAYGNNPKRSSLLTERRVSELIHGVNISGYLSLTMDGIAPIVDGLGGVKMVMDQDYTDIDPSYTKGASLTLKGAQAENFVRVRDTSRSGSNLERMQRQALFLQCLFDQMQGRRIGARRLLELSEDYLSTDLDVDAINDLLGYRLIGQGETLPGEYREGQNHDEYYVDDEAVQEMLIRLFYQPRT